MRASSFGCHIRSPSPSGISRSAKASARCSGGDELLARHQEEQVEHLLVEHLPGADLLLDHVAARLLEVHAGRGL